MNYLVHLNITRHLHRLAIPLAVAVSAVPCSALAADDAKVAATSVATTQRHHQMDNADFSTQARQAFPWYVSAGIFFPTFSEDGVSSSAGGELAVGYRFATDNADFRVSARGQTYSASDSSGNSLTATNSVLSFDALFRFGQFYVGPGIGYGEVNGIINGFAVSGDSATVYSATGGYDFSNRLFVEARWQTGNVDTYKGVSVSVGYRF